MKIQHLEWEKQLSEWEKIFANEATDKGLTSTIYIKLMQLYIRKNKNSIKKIGGGRAKMAVTMKKVAVEDVSATFEDQRKINLCEIQTESQK